MDAPQGMLMRGVATYPRHGLSRLNAHERVSCAIAAERVASFLGLPALGEFEEDAPASCIFFVPGETLLQEEARALGITGPDQLLGGVVPHAFVGSKAITHGLGSPEARHPDGWVDLSAALGDAVLPGFTVFSPDDLERAGRQLLAHGPIRLKHAFARAGLGQSVVSTEAELMDAIGCQLPSDIETPGIVVEPNLTEVETLSVGWTTLGTDTVSYYGRQRLTRDNQGFTVYGGSDLTLVRGGPERLLIEALAPDIRRAIEQACVYDAVASRAYPSFFASRRNYDVALGRMPDGTFKSGVLEQSWRIGGASGAEIAAFERFRDEPSRQRTRCSTDR